MKFRRYLPFGDIRGNANDVATLYGYTGQRRDSTNLMWYQSRYYDPLVGRFTQADTIVPDAATPAAFNRYSYVINNPLRYNDPTGHCWAPVEGASCPAELAGWFSADCHSASRCEVSIVERHDGGDPTATLDVETEGGAFIQARWPRQGETAWSLANASRSLLDFEARMCQTFACKQGGVVLRLNACPIACFSLSLQLDASGGIPPELSTGQIGLALTYLWMLPPQIRVTEIVYLLVAA